MPKQAPQDEREHLLRRVQADHAQVQAEITWVQEQTRRLLEIEAVRPLTPDEAEQGRAIKQQANVLRLRLRQLRAEFAQLQGDRPEQRGRD